jgi:5,10-methylene-tetrahydrofolate dehydrogenase/methenyl tetrahydrofolate cyclohydrolase
MARLLDGKLCAKTTRGRIRAAIAELTAAGHAPPHVVFVQVGSIPASTSYVNAKSKAAENVGMRSTIERIPEQVSQAELLAQLQSYNVNADIHGVLVQLPLPAQIDPLAVALAIAPEKDIDCFNPVNVGRMTIGLPGPRPATPQGILMLLDHYGIDVRGMQAVVIGRSNLVGKPMGLMLLERSATVSWCHSATRDLRSRCRHELRPRLPRHWGPPRRRAGDPDPRPARRARGRRSERNPAGAAAGWRRGVRRGRASCRVDQPGARRCRPDDDRQRAVEWARVVPPVRNELAVSRSHALRAGAQQQQHDQERCRNSSRPAQQRQPAFAGQVIHRRFARTAQVKPQVGAFGWIAGQ